MTICDGDYTIRFIDLPDTIDAVVAMDDDNHANIYVNARAATNVQRRAIRHELAHLQRDDCYNDAPIRAIEGVVNHA